MLHTEYRVNNEIHVPEVRLVDENGEQTIVKIIEAQLRADQVGLDLVEIVPTATPPVCKIMDYGKFIYELKRKKKDAEKKARASKMETKELRLRPTTDNHDIDIKVKHARAFLEEGNRVRFMVKFRGRELNYLDNGINVLNQVLSKLGESVKIEQNITQSGNNFVLTVAPN